MTSHAEELWYKHSQAEHDGDVVPKQVFLAALHEYGALVRARDAEVCKSPKEYGGRGPSDTRIRAWAECAAAIEHETLP